MFCERCSGCEQLADHEGPCFSVWPVDDLTLELRLPAQALDERRAVSAHRVRASLRSPVLEVRLYAAVSRVRLLDVGVWSIGAYVHWERERQLDFALIDAVDACLRETLPAGGGVPTFERGGLLSKIAEGKVAFSFRP